MVHVVAGPPPEQNVPVQRPPAPTIDNDWLRQVDRAFGGNRADIQRIQMENLQVLQAQPSAQRLQVAHPQFEAATQEVEFAQQQLRQQRLNPQGQPPPPPQQQQPRQQWPTTRPPPSLIPPGTEQPMSRAEEAQAQYAAVRRMLEWDDARGRRRSAPTPTNVPAAAGGGAARNPLPS